MARPREFDTEALLDQAGLAFLKDGLQLTTMRNLEDLTGVKQVSLYNAFGSKEGLFLAAFDRYTERVAAAQRSHLDGRGLDGIESFVKSIVSSDSPLPLAEFGCLIVNKLSQYFLTGFEVGGQQFDGAVPRACGCCARE